MASPCRCLLSPGIGFFSPISNAAWRRNMSMLAIWDASSFQDIPKRLQFWYTAQQWDVDEMLYRKNMKLLREDQAFREERYKSLGPDLSAATFIVHREGKVKFTHLPKWTNKTSSRVEAIPNKKTDNFYLEGIDASGMRLLPVGFDNFRHLKHFKYLNLSSVKEMDDWHLDKLVRFSDTLEFLDISNNPYVTAEGLACLYKLRNLKCLNVENCTGIKYGDVVITYLLELNPELTVLGQESLPKEEVSLPEKENLDRFRNIGDILDSEPIDTSSKSEINQSAVNTEDAELTMEEPMKTEAKHI